MPCRPVILAGMVGGVAWAIAVLMIGAHLSVPIGLIQPVLMGAVFAPGVVMIAMVGWIGLRRFSNDGIIDGGPLPPGSRAEIDQRVLTNTVEQIALALCIWPLAGFFLGAGTVLALGIGFAVARVLFWVGYHISPPLRGFGFAATFYPTIGAAFLVLYRLMT